METEDPHTKAGEEKVPPRTNVVRLPRDWIGPREDLVPFGPRARARSEIDPDRTENMAMPEPPPAAEDFWGERSAAIHDPLQAPAEDWDAGVAPRRTLRLASAGRWRAVAAAASGLAIIGATIVAAGGLGVSGPQHHVLGGSKLSVAAVLSSGVSRILKLGLPQIDVGASRPRARAVARPRPRAGRGEAHSEPAVRRSAQVNSVQPASTYSPPAPAASPAGGSPSNDANSTPVSRPSPPGASVSATGESGALGPIQSPNG